MRKVTQSKLLQLTGSVGYLHSEEIEPVSRNFCEYQGVPLSKPSSAVLLGRFYEMTTMALYGGRLTRKETIKNGGDQSLTQLDVVVEDGQKKIVSAYESKACVSGGSLNLRDVQISGQSQVQLKHPDARISFVVYRHTLQGIRDCDWEDERLFRELASKRTSFSLVLPLSLIRAFHQRGKLSDMCIDYDTSGGSGPDSKQGVSVKSGVINELLVNPKGVLGKLGLPPSSFEIRRLRTPTVHAGGLRVENNLVRSFPVLSVSDKYHSAWLDEFRKEVVEEI